MIYKTVSEVVAALEAEFKLPTYVKPKTTFTYVPWTASKKLLDEVFGIFGWETTTPTVLFAPITQGNATGVYTVSFGLVVRALDDENGALVEKILPAVGQAVSYGTDDNAAKSAMSDALSRGVKMLGRAFGFELYEKSYEEETSSAPQQQSSTSRPTTPSDRRPSEKQAAILKNQLHFSDKEIGEMPFSQWKAALDEHFAAKTGGF